MAKAAPGSFCNQNSDCDLCNAEYCYQNTCYAASLKPCPLTCTTCTQIGDTTSCDINVNYCDNLTGSCVGGTCNINSDFINNPTGCDFYPQSDGPQCEACNVCGNGICEKPSEDAINCQKDCLKLGDDPGLPSNPPNSCGAVDLPGNHFKNCDDGDVCTADSCNFVPIGDGFTYVCDYQPKGCSQATADFCCPSGCVDDVSAGKAYDIDCCVVPPPSPSPLPSPRVSPLPSPQVSPLPSPQVSPLPSPQVSPLPSPQVSPLASPLPSPKASPLASPQVSPQPSPSPGPKPSPVASPLASPPVSPAASPLVSPEVETPGSKPEVSPNPGASVPLNTPVPGTVLQLQGSGCNNLLGTLPTAWTDLGWLLPLGFFALLHFKRSKSK